MNLEGLEDTNVSIFEKLNSKLSNKHPSLVLQFFYWKTSQIP
jgi:hypothetical protein